MTPCIDVELVTSSPNGADNLGLQYLAAALQHAGHRPRIHLFRGIQEFDAIATQVIDSDVPVLGVSILSGYTAIDALAFIHLVRRRGYRGHIVCGGIYATLCRQRLLKENPGIDSIVRHDGEVTFVKLVDALAAGAAPETVPGVTTRSGDGLPAPVNDCSYQNLQPTRYKPLLYAGVPAAKVSAVRGCHGHCTYCGLKALRKDSVNEASRLGLSRKQMKEMGIGGMRRRATESVADEMAVLYHTHGVRFFHFVDENHLPADPRAAAAMVHALCDALDDRGVEKRAVSMMLRADVATKEVVAALDRLGIVRGLLGVESTDPDGLGTLGRRSYPAANTMAIRNLDTIPMMYHFNILLLHPESTMESIEAEINGLRHVSGGGLIDVFNVEPFEGTALFERLEREERLVGGPLLWHFWPEDAAARRFSEYILLVKRELFGFTHLTAFAYESLGAYAVARRLGLFTRGVRGQDKAARRLIARHNALWISLLRTLARFARNDTSYEDMQAFLRQIQVDSANLILAFREFRTNGEAISSQSLRSETFYGPTAAAVAVAFSILAASACSHVDNPLESDTSYLYDTDSARQPDTESDSGGIDLPVDTAPVVWDSDGNCVDYYTQSEEIARLEETALAAGCLDLYTICYGVDDFRYAFVLDDEGYAVDMVKEQGTPLDPEIVECYMEAVSGQQFPCLANWKYGQVWRCDYVLLE